ncbi:MAG: hypothetical protein NTY95_01645 [Bacteroidia bacterium]|jgi:uncharacterized membrane protein YeaQ/YmgE (transglycosylase-associated protein family)|nr:hypothetical protein [Bacteroidia bacterium]
MIGISFVSFLILLVISVAVSAILHFGFKFYIRPGIVSFVSKIVFGWIGAWLGSPVFGSWFGGLVYEKIYIIPAILGSLALLIIMVDLVLTVKNATADKT